MLEEVIEYSRPDSLLLKRWQLLWDNSPWAHFFNSPQWYLASGSGQVAAVYRGGELAAVVPLRLSRRFGVLAWSCPGGRHLSKSGLLLKEGDESMVASLAGYLAGKGNYYLSELDGRLAQMFISRQPGAARRESSVSPYLPLSGDPLVFLSARQRKKIASLAARHQGRLSYVCRRGCKDALRIAYEIDRESSKSKKGRPSFEGAGDLRFFERLVDHCGQEVEVDLLYCDGVPAVFSVGFFCKGSYHACLTSYNDRFKQIAPRKLLLFFLLQRLKSEGARLFDFSRGQSELKKEFTPLSAKQYDIFYSNSRLVRLWWSAAERVRSFLTGSGFFYSAYARLKAGYLSLYARY